MLHPDIKDEENRMEGIANSHLIVWKFITIAALSFMGIMIIAVAVILMKTAHEIQGRDKEVEKVKNENINLTYSLNNSRQAYETLKAKMEQVQNNLTYYENLTTFLNATVQSQAAKISSLSKTKNYLWIAEGSSVAAAAGSVGYAIYENHELGIAKDQIITLQNSLDKALSKAKHFETYFDHSFIKLIDDIQTFYRQGHFV